MEALGTSVTGDDTLDHPLQSVPTVDTREAADGRPLAGGGGVWKTGAESAADGKRSAPSKNIVPNRASRMLPLQQVHTKTEVAGCTSNSSSNNSRTSNMTKSQAIKTSYFNPSKMRSSDLDSLAKVTNMIEIEILLDWVDEPVNSPAEAAEAAEATETAEAAVAEEAAAEATAAAAELPRRRRCKSTRCAKGDKSRLKLHNQGIYALDHTFCY